MVRAPTQVPCAAPKGRAPIASEHMSRLDSFLRRIIAQRDCLNSAVELVAGLDGPVIELGLGNGRTYDHLREILPGREIFVFDRRIAAHPDCVPDAAHMIVGDIRETLPNALARIPGRAALAHCDIGTGDAAANAEIAAFVGRHLVALLAPGAVVVSDQAMARPEWEPVALPAGIRPGRYYMWRVRS